MPFDPMLLCPAQDRIRDELGAVVGNGRLRLAPRIDERRQLGATRLPEIEVSGTLGIRHVQASR
jgi:hypothetical protein